MLLSFRALSDVTHVRYLVLLPNCPCPSYSLIVGRQLWLSGLLLVWSCGRIGFDPLAEDSATSDSGAIGDIDADTVAGPLPLPETGIDLTNLEAHWDFDVASASDGATFAAFPNSSLVATLETGDAGNVIEPGKIGGSIHFDGIDDRLVVPDSSALDLSGPHSLTTWIYMDQLPTNDYGLIGKESAYTLEIEGDTDCIDLAVYLPGGGFDELAPTDCALSAGAWHHVASVYDGTQLLVYQNGQLVGTLPYSGSAVIENDNPVLIGHNTFQPGRYMDGRLDELTIWSRALTSDEVRTLEELQRPDPE